MKLASTIYFDRKLRKKISKNPQLKRKISKQLKIVIQNPFHPSLKTHKLKGRKAEEFSFWIEGNLRVTYQIVKDTIILTDLISHDEHQ
jgi:mRNA-degrading endonuclease YafQ of YafQ-DinJ toxin-antitoxin module